MLLITFQAKYIQLQHNELLSIIPVLSESFVTMAWCIIRLLMKEMASSYGD
jgi:hypothetical protein